MEQCSYCNWMGATVKAIVHDPNCPEVLPSKRDLYGRGWDDGRLGEPEALADPTYQMGYGNGVCAAEEAENGFKAWGY